ncbi:MAG: DUF418 domain-containing protein [Gammaproteobacteria bacterium]
MNLPKQGRIEVIDAIRGFAIFGILIANIQSWSGYKYLPFEKLAQLPYFDLDGLFYWLHIALIDGKFYAIFSMLFGIGFGIQWERKGHKPESFLPMYHRRLAFLLLFGVLHALLWSGDILTLYALLAFVMVALRGLSKAALLGLALGLLGFFVLSNFAYMSLGEPIEPIAKVARTNYADMRWDTIISAFAGTDLAEVFRVNWHNIYWRWVGFIPSGRISRVLGFFLIGCYLARSGFFLSAAQKPRNIFLFGVPGLALTLLAMELGLSMSSWPRTPEEIFSKAFNVVGQTLMALSYMCILSCVFGSALGRTLLQPLTLVGRMAFTSYISQTLIGITIFYGIGFGLIGTLGLAQLWLLALVIYAAQVLMASFWLKHCKQGPIEWLWRCLTIKQFTPLRRTD